VTATLPRPGSVVTIRSSSPPRVVPTDTGVWFVTGFTDRGPLQPVLLQSLSDFTNTFGARQTYSPLYDALETYFREGGAKAYLSRVVGPAAVVASIPAGLLDGVAAISLNVKAKGPGAYANTMRVTVQNPGIGGTASSFSLLITDTVLGTLEQSPDFTTQAAAIGWAASQSQYINLTLGASLLIPVAISNAAFTLGADDRTNATDANWRTAQALFTRDLGPGQITQVGRTTTTAHTDTIAHAVANNRVAVLDAPDSPTIATVTAAAASQRSAINLNDTWGAMFAPWVVIPGLVPNTTRIVPPSALVAAKIARNDAISSPNDPAAGYPEGVASFVIGLSQPAYDNGAGPDVTRDDMYTKGINQIVFRYLNYEIFGWRTLTDPVGANQDWINFGNRRLAMAMTAKGLAILEYYILDEIDGQGRLFARLRGQLSDMCMQYFVMGSLFPDATQKPETAFVVVTDATVNTITTIANREIHAAIGARMSQDGELAVLEIAKVPITQGL
jgi:phage tail sheath protein FI